MSSGRFTGENCPKTVRIAFTKRPNKPQNESPDLSIFIGDFRFLLGAAIDGNRMAFRRSAVRSRSAPPIKSSFLGLRTRRTRPFVDIPPHVPRVRQSLRIRSNFMDSAGVVGMLGTGPSD